MDKQIQIQEQMHLRFQKERKFYLNNTNDHKEAINNLKTQIEQLNLQISEEQGYTQKAWTEAQVEVLCTKAMYNYKFMQICQSEKITKFDIRDKPDGHVIVSKEEQQKYLTKNDQRENSPLRIEEHSDNLSQDSVLRELKHARECE